MTTVKKVLAAKPAPKPTNRRKLIVGELGGLGKGKILHAKDAHPDDIVASYIAVNNLKKIAEAREKHLKPFMHEVAERLGETNEQGGQYVVLANGDSILREKRRDSEPDDDKLRALLQTRAVEIDEVYDEVKTLVMNASKLKFLVDKGKLKAEEVEALHGYSFAIKARPGPELEALLTEALLPKKEEAPPPSVSGKRVRR